MSWHSFIGLNVASPVLQIEGLAICFEVMKHNKMPGHCKIFQGRICTVDLKALLTEKQEEET